MTSLKTDETARLRSDARAKEPELGGWSMTQLKILKTNISWRLAPRRMIDKARPLADPDLDDVYMKRGLILIHIPKNAGTSVEDAIYGYRVRHRTWREIQETCPRSWSALPKIAILRDPVDRFLSAFDYLKSGGRNELDRRFGARMIGRQSIESFLNRFSSCQEHRETLMRYFHFRRQVDFVCDESTVMVDHLIPFHRMAEGLVKVAGVEPKALVHANRTTGKRTQICDLSQSTLEQIKKFYASDLSLFESASEAWENSLVMEAGMSHEVSE